MINGQAAGVQMSAGHITRISGPIVRAKGLSHAGLYDVVEVGGKGLIGEIVRLENDEAMIQVYEDNTGLMINEEVKTTGRPLSVLLGPGIIGAVYDGIQRPLKVLYEKSGPFMEPGSSAFDTKSEPLDSNKKWLFIPEPDLASRLLAGEKIPACPGLVLGTVRETESISCKIMVPPSSHNLSRLSHGSPSIDINPYGYISSLAEQGEMTCHDIAARIDNGREIALAEWWPVRVPRPNARRLSPDIPLITGQRVIDVFFPLSRGGAAAIPGGFGTGKTSAQHAVAKWCDADVIVYIGCGERGNEISEVLMEFPQLKDPRTGRSLMERTILIANTSNMPVAAREISIYTGVTLAEFYRDMGLHVAIMADSTSRWAEALRELSGRMEEMPAEEGFPAYLPTKLAEFYERAGRIKTLCGLEGSISIIGAISPPGGDFSEPVTQHTKRFIRCFWALDRDLASSRHYPAISWIDSYSEYADEIKHWWEKVNPQWDIVRKKALELLKKEQRLEEIVRLIGPDALPDDQRLILVAADIIKNGFLQQNSFDEVDMYSAPQKQVRLLELIMEFYDRCNLCIKLGAPLYKINSLPVKEELSRLKNLIRNEEFEKFGEFEMRLRQSLEELERSYRNRETI